MAESTKARVNGLFRGGDPRPRSERYNGGSILGVKVSGGSAASEEYRAAWAQMRCARQGEGNCSLEFGHKGVCTKGGD